MRRKACGFFHVLIQAIAALFHAFALTPANAADLHLTAANLAYEFEIRPRTNGGFHSDATVFFASSDSRGTSLPALTVDFSWQKELTFRVDAPVGKKFVVEPPRFYPAATLEIALTTADSQPLSPIQFFPGGFSLFGASGVGARSHGSALQFTSGGVDGFRATAGAYGISGPIEFVAFEASWTFPEEFIAAFMEVPFVNSSIALRTSRFQTSDPLGDPGQWVRLVPIPEPPNSGIVVAMLLGILSWKARM